MTQELSDFLSRPKAAQLEAYRNFNLEFVGL